MRRVSSVVGRKVLLPRKKAGKRGESEAPERYQRIGKVHSAVFSPDGRRVVGFTVSRPDIVGMIKREDEFVAWDSFELGEGGKDIVVTRPDDGTGTAARHRLALDWGACIIWTGMDARTVDGKPFGYVSDAEYDEKTGEVTRFFTTEGGMSHALIGSFVIPAEMVRGYSKGHMVIDPGDRAVQLDGGLAAAAGEGYARAKTGVSKAGRKAGAVASTAVDKGTFALGKAIGKAKRSVTDAAASERGTATTTGDSSSGRASSSGGKARPAASTSDKIAQAAGRQLGAMGKMFDAFKDEYKKASR